MSETVRRRGMALAAVLLAFSAVAPVASAIDPPQLPTPNPTIVPGAPTPTPRPTPIHLARLVAALDVEQGDGGERTALFDDGTVVHVVRFKGRSVTNRHNVTTNELELVGRVVAEALTVSATDAPVSPVLEADRRRFRIEVADGTGKPKTYRFDDLSQMPLAIARARGALEDLRARFYGTDIRKEEQWDPAGLKEGSLLRRRGDARMFKVARDDRFEQNLELSEVGGSGTRLFLKREDVPKVFEDPEPRDGAGR